MNHARVRQQKRVNTDTTTWIPEAERYGLPSIRTCPGCTLNADAFSSRKAFAEHKRDCAK